MIRRDFTRTQGRSYAGPRLRNPFFAHGPNRLGRIAGAAFVILVPIVLIVVFIYAPFMQYRGIEVQGLTTLSVDEVRAVAEEQLHRRTALIIPGTHILFARERTIAASLTERFSFEEVVAKRQNGILRIVAKERISEIAWRAGNATFLLDLHGRVVREASPEAIATIDARLVRASEIPFAPGIQPAMPILIDDSATETTIGTSLLSEEIIGDVLALDEMLRARSLLPVGYHFATPDTPWLTVDIIDGPSLLFDMLVGEPATALGYLDAYILEYASTLPNLSYIDLRFENHLYTKPR